MKSPERIGNISPKPSLLEGHRSEQKAVHCRFVTYRNAERMGIQRRSSVLMCSTPSSKRIDGSGSPSKPEPRAPSPRSDQRGSLRNRWSSGTIGVRAFDILTNAEKRLTRLGTIGVRAFDIRLSIQGCQSVPYIGMIWPPWMCQALGRSGQR